MGNGVVWMPGREPGERDMTLGEVEARGKAMFGRRRSSYKLKDDRCVVAIFADDHWDRSPVERAEIIMGYGASFDEAFRRARARLLTEGASGLNLKEEDPPKHDVPVDGAGPCRWGCHR